ncbi:hypothetical protein AGLY_006805 [Aphis glycines]|uniref:Uncharacterized protein n=1 Tax=Aphis glycines TaxID=307491 RepID=A0A6G0TQV7_APHGL|nr:hypothetical protein AGLY_006805 [Aphis glycines]
MAIQPNCTSCQQAALLHGCLHVTVRFVEYTAETETQQIPISQVACTRCSLVAAVYITKRTPFYRFMICIRLFVHIGTYENNLLKINFFSTLSLKYDTIFLKIINYILNNKSTVERSTRLNFLDLGVLPVRSLYKKIVIMFVFKEKNISYYRNTKVSIIWIIINRPGFQCKVRLFYLIVDNPFHLLFALSKCKLGDVIQDNQSYYTYNALFLIKSIWLLKDCLESNFTLRSCTVEIFDKLKSTTETFFKIMMSIFVTGFARLNYNSNKDLFREIIIEFYSFGMTRNDRDDNDLLNKKVITQVRMNADSLNKLKYDEFQKNNLCFIKNKSIHLKNLTVGKLKLSKSSNHKKIAWIYIRISIKIPYLGRHLVKLLGPLKSQSRII